MSRRVAILTLGCKVNSYDTATIGDRLRTAGCTIVEGHAPRTSSSSTRAP
jgi:tRNA A37 methylthiotransferase MiaB